MVYYFRKYPVSLFIIGTVLYLSFFKPPSTGLNTVTHLDKVVHFCMYFGMSGALWLEFIRNHKDSGKWGHACLGALVCPVILSGIIEVLQEYATSYRGGDWFDFLANTLGALSATFICYFIIRPRVPVKNR